MSKAQRKPGEVEANAPAVTQSSQSGIPELAPADAYRLQQRGAQLIDVRGPEQCQTGMARQALNIPRDHLASRLPDHITDTSRPILTICAQGKQSLLAVAELQVLGYRNVHSVTGGFTAWQAASLPVSYASDSVLSDSQQERYARHLSLPEVGPTGQRKLLDSKVLLVGAGGLGSPAALYLAAAGVGTLGIVDDDRVERSNLQRQVIHHEASTGSKKIASASHTIRQLNQATHVLSHDVRLTTDNADELIAGYDMVIDGSDNFATRYALNQACVAAGKPLVFAAVEAFQAQVAVFWPAYDHQSACYQCVFPQPGDGPSCVEAGVLGVVPGVAGILQATEALKLALQIGKPLVNRLLRIDTLTMRFTESRTMPDPDCKICARSAIKQQNM